MPQFPVIINSSELEQHLNDDNFVIIDLCKIDSYRTNHVPGAVHFNYGHIVQVEKPIMGKVPDNDKLVSIFSALGINHNSLKTAGLNILRLMPAHGQNGGITLIRPCKLKLIF